MSYKLTAEGDPRVGALDLVLRWPGRSRSEELRG
jgi:hypothetical protein